MEFTKKDRDFLVKAMNEFQQLSKRVKTLEDSAKVAREIAEAASQPVFDFQSEDTFFDDSDVRALSITFKTQTDESNKRSREILTQTIYKAIKDLCVINGIESIALTMENV